MDASNRQERLRMRQRGAGTRKIDAVDFGISFDPTPRRSPRNTPQPTSQRRQSRTPLTARGAPRRPSRTPSKGTTLPSAADSSSQDARSVSAQPRPDLCDGPQEELETRSRKRRKLSSEHDNVQLITPATSQASDPSIFGRRSTSGRKSSGLPIQIAEEPEQTQSELVGENAGQVAGGSPGGDKENAIPGTTQVEETPRTALSKKTPRTGKSTVQSRPSRSSRSSSRQSENISIISATGDVDSEDEVLVAVLEDSDEEDSEDNEQEEVSLFTAQGDLPDTTMELVAVLDETALDGDEAELPNVIDPTLLAESQTETSAPRSANIKKKRISLKSPSQQSNNTLHPSSDNSVQQAESELTTPLSVQATPHGHPASDDSFYQANHDDDDQTYLEPTSPILPTPKTVAKKPRRKNPTTKPRRRASNSSSASTQNKRKKGKSTTFPILTHRLTNTSALPTITEEPEPDTDTDTEAGGTLTKFPDRPTPNAVDVLAQFCREDIEAALDTTTSTAAAPTGSRATLKRKRLALQSFRSALESRLFDLSNAVEHRLSLQAQLKQSTREKAEMQAKWMEVRRERERVARRMDELSRRKEEVEREVEGRRGLSERIWRVEGEVEKGAGGGEGEGDGGGEGLEWKLRMVAEGVSGRLGGGLLERVREFNGVLERMVGVLDSRKEGR